MSRLYDERKGREKDGKEEMEERKGEKKQREEEEGKEENRFQQDLSLYSWSENCY